MDKQVMDKLMARAGAKDYAIMKNVYIEKDDSREDPNFTVTINGVVINVKRGMTTDLPEPVYLILKEAGRLGGGAVTREDSPLEKAAKEKEAKEEAAKKKAV